MGKWSISTESTMAGPGTPNAFSGTHAHDVFPGADALPGPNAHDGPPGTHAAHDAPPGTHAAHYFIHIPGPPG